jgi:hypothetical protein
VSGKRAAGSKLTRRGGYSGSTPLKPIKVPSGPGASSNATAKTQGENTASQAKSS